MVKNIANLKNPRAIIKILFVTFFLFSFYPSIAESQEERTAQNPQTESKSIESKPEKPSGTPTMPPEIEGIGLYDRADEGSLGRDLWDNMDRVQIEKLIESIPTGVKSAPVQNLVFGALLTKSALKNLDSNAPTRAGADILSLRLGKLIDAGAYSQAMELYTAANLDAPPESIARAGILAMLFTGQKSLACVEKNTLGAMFPESDFFKTIGAYCDLSMVAAPPADAIAFLESSKESLIKSLPKKPKDWRFVYSPESFNALSITERAIVVGDGALTIPPRNESDFRDIPARDIQILMKAPGLSDRDKFVLNLRALDWGLIRPSDLKNIYVSSIDRDERLDPALAPPPDSADWQKLPYFLQIAVNKKSGPEQWAQIQSALDLTKKYGIAAAIPFVDVLKTANPGNIDLKTIEIVVRIFNQSGESMPGQWIEIIEKFKSTPEESALHARLLTAAWISTPPSRRSNTDKDRILKALSGNDKKLAYLINYFIETLDKSVKEIHTQEEIYENGIDLTFDSNYVMPTLAVWNHLQGTGEKASVGEVVGLSASALKRGFPGEIYPALLVDILRSLKNVGLTDISNQIAIAAVLGSSDL